MLSLQDVIYAKNDKKKVILHEPFTRVYLEYDKSTPTETKESKVNSVNDDGTVEVKKMNVVVPVEDPSKVDTATFKNRLDDAVIYLSEKFPKSNPIFLLLSHASNGLNLEMRKEAAPTKETKAKPVSEDEAIRKSAALLVRGGMFADIEAATTFVKSAKKAA
jgi:hypothetical protein